MKVMASVKKICRNCKIVRRKGVVRVICAAMPAISSVKDDARDIGIDKPLRKLHIISGFRPGSERTGKWPVLQASTSRPTSMPSLRLAERSSASAAARAKWICVAPGVKPDAQGRRT